MEIGSLFQDQNELLLEHFENNKNMVFIKSLKVGFATQKCREFTW